jgi:AAA domain
LRLPELDHLTRTSDIGLVGLDPLIKAHAVDENDNMAMDHVVSLVAQMAVDYNIAGDLTHHTHKGLIKPGHAENSRGATSIKDAPRLIYQANPMSDDERKQFPELKDDIEREFIRIDSAKVNLVKRTRKASWFELTDVALGNATEKYPSGDHIQVIRSFQPVALGSFVNDQVAESILEKIGNGLIDATTGQPTGGRYSKAAAAKDRAAWLVVKQFCPALEEKACRAWIDEQVENGKLEERAYTDTSRQQKGGKGARRAKGLFRPQTGRAAPNVYPFPNVPENDPESDDDEDPDVA